MTTTWTDIRLQHLYAYYNRRFWNNQLPRYRVCQQTISDDALAYVLRRRRQIIIDIDQHQSDRQIRSTLLHEMAHVAAGPGTGHDSAFFEQLERLLHMRAPIRPAFPENQRRPLLESIPKRFRLCRRALAPLYNRRQRQIKKEFASASEESLEDVFLERVEEAALHGATWKSAVILAGTELGMLDIDDHLLPWARRYAKPARQAYRQGRQVYLLFAGDDL
jgi:hypothetical protein